MTVMASASLKDELIVEVAKDIVSLPQLGPEWKSLSLVFTFEEYGSSSFGYYYIDVSDGQRDWRAFSGRSDKLRNDVIRLREAMRDGSESKAEWYQGLFQLVRSEAKLIAEFTYNGETRWQVTPANHEQMVHELRPHA
jgi:hypothetical protein